MERKNKKREIERIGRKNRKKRFDQHKLPRDFNT